MHIYININKLLSYGLCLLSQPIFFIFSQSDSFSLMSPRSLKGFPSRERQVKKKRFTKYTLLMLSLSSHHTISFTPSQHQPRSEQQTHSPTHTHTHTLHFAQEGAEGRNPACLLSSFFILWLGTLWWWLTKHEAPLNQPPESEMVFAKRFISRALMPMTPAWKRVFLISATLSPHRVNLKKKKKGEEST